MTDELVSRTTRGLFRTLMTGSTVGQIAAAFQDEGFAPNPDCTYDDSSVRRQTTQAYLEAVDWTDPRHVARVLRVFGRLMHGFEAQYTEQLRHSLHQDGYVTDSDTGHIMPAGPQFAACSLAGLNDASAIREQLDRIQRAIADDPALAVGSAKELIESTAKVVLAERGLPVSDKADLPELVRQAQQALRLHPSSAAPGPDGTEAVRRILGGASTIAAGLAELRNRGYGTGHGAAGARIGLRPRHAHLAVNAAFTWCQLMLDTLADPDAPWRGAPGS
jgi:Abortive infection C-terminus